MANFFKETSPTPSAPGEVDCRFADEIELQIAGLSGGDSISVSRSLDGESYVPHDLRTADFAPATNPFTADGIYWTDGGARLRFTKSGSASEPSITLRLSTD